MYIDTHCHFDISSNPEEIIRSSEKQRIITIGMTNLPSHFEIGINHVKEFRYVRLALGLHPLMALKHSTELVKFKNNINKTSYIGEVGLDFSSEGISTIEIQIKSFEYVLNTIKGQKKILSIHSRRAEIEVLTLLKKYEIKNVIFHWYSGPISVLKSIIDNGYFCSVNTAMIKNKSGQKIISEIPINKILTETDSPYILNNGVPTKPEDVRLVIKYLSFYYKKSEQEMIKQVYDNFKELIKNIT